MQIVDYIQFGLIVVVGIACWMKAKSYEEVEGWEEIEERVKGLERSLYGHSPRWIGAISTLSPPGDVRGYLREFLGLDEPTCRSCKQTLPKGPFPASEAPDAD